MLTSHAAFGDIHYPAYTQTLIISENLHAARFLTQTAQCVFDGALRKVPFKINEKAVFPAPLLNRAALDLRHIQIIVDEMGQYMVKRTALVRYLQTNTDLISIRAEYLLVRYDDKPRRIVITVVNALLQHGKPVYLCSVSACQRRLCPIAFVSHFPRRERIVF